MSLTRKQQKVYDFIKDYIDEHGESPTYQEIQEHFNFKSLGSVVDYVNYLKKASLVRTTNAHSSRSLELVEQSEPNMLIPILGKVAAGSPLELGDRDYTDSLSVPESMVRSGDCFALQVQGDSMIEDGIFDGDYVVIKSAKDAKNGDTVVALVDGAATIKTFFRKKNKVELHPANAALSPIIVDRAQDLQIQGHLVALFRKY